MAMSSLSELKKMYEFTLRDFPILTQEDRDLQKEQLRKIEAEMKGALQ